MAHEAGCGGHAIVIGASMAGLTVARALADRFERVTVLDRDRVPDGVAHRNGVPQGRHLHVLLAAGVDALEQLFPGLFDEMVAAGAPTGDLDRTRVFLNGHRYARGRIGRDGIAASRPFIEAHVRWRVRDHPVVTIDDGREVRGLAASVDGRRVVGVRVGTATDGAAEETLPAEVVVDCSGRRSRTPGWLEELGYAPPAVDELRVDLGYATRSYRLPDDALDGDLFVLIGPTPDGPRGGGMVKVEGDRWLVTLFAMAGERPSLDPDGYAASAARLPIPDLHDALGRGQPLDAPTAFRYPASVRRRYERLRQLPAGLLVAGDALCSFNPIYGQGMTVAALEALTLRRLLRSGSAPAAPTWFSAIAPTVGVAWDLAVGADLAIRRVQGRRSLRTRMVNGYVARFHAAAAHDPTLAGLFMRVTGLLDPPSRLLRPATVARVVAGNLRRTPDRRPPGGGRRSGHVDAGGPPRHPGPTANG